MPRARDPRRDEAFAIYLEKNGNIQNREIAKILDVPEKTISGWKSKDNWTKHVTGVLQKNKRSTPKKIGGQPGNKNAKGHGVPKRNSNAVTHGFFAKYLPEETKEIMECLKDRPPADLIWDQIQIQYAAIIRAQRIMFVKDHDDLTKELKRTKEGYSDSGSTSEEEYELQFAWDKHAAFLTAQSRAMGELRSLVKQFDDMTNIDDERRLRLEQMRLNIDKSKAELAQINGETEGNAHEQANNYVKALNSEAENVFDDEVLEDEEA